MTHRKLCAFGLLLLLVLLGHGLLLSWLSERVRYLRPLIPMAEPMLTRIIIPVRSAPPVRRPRSVPVRPAVASVVASVVALTPQAEVATLPSIADDQISQATAEQRGPVQTSQSEPAAAVVEASPPLPEQELPVADSWPVDTRLSYRLKGYYRGDMYGSARVQWQREQNRYQVRLDLSMALVLRFTLISQGEVGAVSLLPSVYEERLPWGVRRMAFEGGLVRFDNATQLAAPPALQDTVSQFVELSHRFSSGREVLKTGGEVSVWLARPQGMAFWTYDVVGEEMLETPQLGPVPAFHLRPRPIANPTGVITAELWFAPSLQYLPVRVRIALGADNFVDLLVERIEQGAAPETPQVWQRVEP